MASKVPRGVKVQTERRLSTESACSLCCHYTKVWVVSPCDHHVCLTCAARLRVLCDTKECPVCRENNNKVIVVEKRQSFHSVVSRKNLIPNRKFGFLFESRKLVDAFESLRIPKCVKCEGEGGGRGGEGGGGGGSNRFTNMKALQDHLRKEHHLLMCEICVDHLKLFPHEYKLYTREQLARHRREGDPGDPAYKGHPLCQFCEERFLDTETLFFHLKNKHFWCHICEVDGSQDYYASYPELRTHFRQSHYLCSEGPCRYEKFTTVFRTKLDFQAHKAKEHCKGLSKAEAKQLRQVDVGFVYSKTEETEGMPPVSQRQYHQQTTRQKKQRPISKEMEDIEAAKTLSLIEQQKKETNPTNSSSSEENSPDPQQQDTAHPLAADKKNGHIPRNKSLPTLTSAAEQKGGPSEWPLLSNETQQETKAPPPVPPNLAPPPGLTCPGHKPPPGFTTASLPVPKVEFDVYEMVQILLDNNMKKVSLFRRWCGMYLMAELTAEQYYQYCSEMFGSAWNEFGLQLVETLPDPVKRTELYSLFDNENKKTTVAIKPPPGLSSSSAVQPSSSRVKSKKTKSQATADVPDTRPWHSSNNRSKVSLKSEEEFPSLSLKSMSKATAPVAAMPWNIKVK